MTPGAPPGYTGCPSETTTLEPPPPPSPPPAVGRGEHTIIRALTPPVLPSGCGVAVGIGDDATVLESGDVWSMDVLVEGVHFDDRLSMEDIGYKAVAVSVSDIAAMGAQPRWLLLGLSLPDAESARVEALTRGVRGAAAHFGLAVVGGDTTRSRLGLVVTSVVGGTCAHPPLLRSNGRDGDDVWVTGQLGAAGSGWSSDHPTHEHLVALRRPQPPVEFAMALARRGLAHAAMDLSDGLALDLERLCAASGLAADLIADRLPVADGADLQTATRGGEDYQLLFTAAADQREAIEELARDLKVQVTRIGSLRSGSGATLDVGWPQPLFEHFGPTP